jgi:signal peptidase I
MSKDASTNSPLWKRLVLGRNPRRTLVRVVLLVFIGLMLWRVTVPVRVSGVSMEPTLTNGRIVVINRLAGAPQRGDVVAIRWAGNRAWLLKRVIALPGERFEIAGNTVRVDGRPLAEPWAQWGGEVWTAKEQTLEADEYLVIGDNRAMPQSEHEFGRVRRARILGKAWF